MQKNAVIAVKRLPHGHGLPLPQRMTAHASGCDVSAAIEEAMTIMPGERALVPTGFCCDIPPGFEIQVRPRSGLAWKHGVTILNTPGTVDADYRGEIKVILINLGTAPYTLNRGERIAQLVPASVAAHLQFTESDELSETPRGSGGFGHTGVTFPAEVPLD